MGLWRRKGGVENLMGNFGIFDWGESGTHTGCVAEMGLHNNVNIPPYGIGIIGCKKSMRDRQLQFCAKCNFLVR